VTVAQQDGDMGSTAGHGADVGQPFKTGVNRGRETEGSVLHESDGVRGGAGQRGHVTVGRHVTLSVAVRTRKNGFPAAMKGYGKLRAAANKTLAGQNAVLKPSQFGTVALVIHGIPP
jgi:hypothetical protein